MEGIVSEMSQMCVRKVQTPKIIVTNTIIVGIKFKNGVMIAYDIRPTIGNNISNIYRLHDNIYAAVTGVGQDICALVNVTQSKLEMHYMTTNYRRIPVRCANQMIKQMLHSQIGSINVNLLIAGVDKYGTSIYSTRFDGSSDTVPFTAIGSGMMSAMSVLETRWCMDLDEASALDVIYEAVAFGTGQSVSSKMPVRLCILCNDYSILHERVETVQSRTLKSWKPQSCVAEEREESGVEKTEGKEGNRRKQMMEEINKQLKD
ncbi:proteasome subunit beta type-2-like isoform X2 [Drosophila serrata]|uniref:proteasome subunit beta type-2-like isoform X2 n=1 Tax=Drosophila serrata TaxID=7274 RepID=UPI000A1D0621|nr:proteasome subunit beta type-2-like isoform X2 [Drosophila serrata]